MKKVLVILGQTATGKSSLAVKIAEKWNGEIISADSRQIYKNLDIGTGKITQEEMHGVPHHLLDVANPKKQFSVSLYKTLAEEKIKEILARGHVPIICGGTGFYIDAVTKGTILPSVPPTKKLRKELDKKLTPELVTELKKLDKRRSREIDPQNQVRIIRAIEIAKALGKVPPVTEETPPYKFIKIGLYLPPEKLKKKVEKRVGVMFKSGLLREIKKLKKLGIPEKRLQELGFEYYNPTVGSVVKATLDYAK